MTLRPMVAVATALVAQAGVLLAGTPAPAVTRLSLSLNQGWQFHRIDAPEPQERFADPSFDDHAWQPVTVPHSVRLEPENASGMRNFQGVCWYRRHFRTEEGWKAKKVFVKFEGAMQVADVWINGAHVTTHFGGYA